MPTAAGFCCATAYCRPYDDPFGIGFGPRGADPEMAYLAWPLPPPPRSVPAGRFIGERNDFAYQIPDGEAKSLGAAWGRQVA